MEKRNANGIHVEVWDRRFFLRMNSFRYSEHYRPAKRPAISIVIALNQPFKLALTPDSSPIFCQSMIVGPNVLRDQFVAQDSDLWVFDVAINTPEYRDLMSTIDVDEVRPLEPQQHERIANLCRAHDMSASAKSLLESIVYSLCEHDNADALDTRISKVLSLIENLPADEVSVGDLAAAVGLSESRLRALFAKQMRCNLSRYIRFIGFWKALLLIVQGKNFTEAAHGAGFHDLSHFNRIVAEFSGFSPTAGLMLFGTQELHQQRKILNP